jgi:hypothetical protein
LFHLAPDTVYDAACDWPWVIGVCFEIHNQAFEIRATTRSSRAFIMTGDTLVLTGPSYSLAVPLNGACSRTPQIAVAYIVASEVVRDEKKKKEKDSLFPRTQSRLGPSGPL